MKKLAKLLSLMILSSIFIQSVMACGPFTVDPLFSFTKHADYPLNDYAKGKVGNIPTSYGRMSLVLFYRQLHNLPLSTSEQKQYVQALSNRIGTHTPDGADETVKTMTPALSGQQQWENSRKKVLSGETKVATEKKDDDRYFSFENCLDAAFETASNTLEARIKEHGIDSIIKEWLSGQDAVFSNCSTNRDLPVKLVGSEPKWLQKDREYQIASALFYQNKYPEARSEFEKIAQDSDSAWQKTAKFVIARTFIREAGVIDVYDANDEKKKERIELYKKASEKLEAIAADSSLSEFHDSAKRLQNYVGFRIKPREQRRELAQKLVQKNENTNFYNDLVDYIWLMDVVENESREIGMETERKEAEAKGKEVDYDYKLKRRDIRSSELGADLTDWLFAYQTADSYPYALAKWNELKSLAWFVAAISKAQKDSSNISELLNEANKIKPDSTAFATVSYHQIRLLTEAGKSAEARQKLNEVIKSISKYPLSTQNDFLSQKMLLAENLDDFLKYSQRKAATFVWSDDVNEEGDDLKDDSEFKAWKERAMFDMDSVGVFNEKLPLSVLRQAALSPTLPNHLKKFLVIAVWTRAFILGNQPIQNEFTPLMAKFAPEYKVSASDETASLLAFGRNPAIQPYVPFGMGRGETLTNSIDSIRGNWWCLENRNRQSSPGFLSAAQKNEATSEQKKISTSGESATFLAQKAVDFANKNMTNPSTPEILHLAVRSTRYGCKDLNTLRYSKMAYDILHKKFPRSEWTKKTPYYFGEVQN